MLTPVVVGSGLAEGKHGKPSPQLSPLVTLPSSPPACPPAASAAARPPNALPPVHPNALAPSASGDGGGGCGDRSHVFLRGKFFTPFVSVSRITIIFKNMSLIIIVSPFLFCCCVFRGRGRRGAVLTEASHHAAHPHTTQMFERKGLSRPTRAATFAGGRCHVGRAGDGWGAVRGGAGQMSRTRSRRVVCMRFGNVAAHEFAEQ